MPVEEAIQKAYGVTSAQFDQAVKDYFHSLTPLFVALDASKQSGSQADPPQVYQFPEIVGPDARTITAKVLREADARALTGESEDQNSRSPRSRPAGIAGVSHGSRTDCGRRKTRRKTTRRTPFWSQPSATRSPTARWPGTTCSARSSTTPPKNWPTPPRSTRAICGSATTFP